VFSGTSPPQSKANLNRRVSACAMARFVRPARKPFNRRENSKPDPGDSNLTGARERTCHKAPVRQFYIPRINLYHARLRDCTAPLGYQVGCGSCEFNGIRSSEGSSKPIAGPGESHQSTKRQPEPSPRQRACFLTTVFRVGCFRTFRE
jgi:hypothetical protein